MEDKLDAATFYREFEGEFASVVETLPGLRRTSAKASKWRVPVADGALLLSFATNAKTAGLNPRHWPGEFRLTLTWSHGPRGLRKDDYVSYFQYTSEAENAQYAQLQRQALARFLAPPEKEAMRALFPYAADPDCLPRANFDEFAHYMDTEDARAWGRWYRDTLPHWLERFAAAPETHEQWCWRVLWPHLAKEQPAAD